MTETCHEEGTCGVQSYPAAQCHRLAIGDSVARAYLLLGEPARQEGAAYGWYAHKTDWGIGVTARFEQGRLIALDCPAAPWAN